MLRGNKGEWSELYALLYLLGIRKLYAADENLERIENIYFPILKVFRQESDRHKIDFILNENTTVEIYLNDNYMQSLTSEDFAAEASQLYDDIRNADGRSFVVNRIEPFANEIFCERLAAASSNVTDISMQIHDINTGYDPYMGFSIKSYLGGAPTLLNASGATNIIYEITGISDEQMNEINIIDTKTKILDRIAKVYEYGGTIQFAKMANEEFASNLKLIDSSMEKILAYMLLYSYSSGIIDCQEIVNHMETENPLEYPRSGFYTYKFKKLLCAKALGMDPSKPWDGRDDANGGYIVVKADGEVLAYHLYNRDMFEQYLISSTRFERASTTRHNYATLYKEDERMYIKLNLQIRFKG